MVLWGVFVMVFVWWCLCGVFCGGGPFMVVLLWCFGGVVVFLCFCGDVFANGLETVRVKWHFFTLLRNGLLRYILYTCPQLNVTRVQSATEWTASVHTLHMSAT